MSKEHHAMMIKTARSEKEIKKVIGYVQAEFQIWELLLRAAKAKQKEIKKSK